MQVTEIKLANNYVSNMNEYSSGMNLNQLTIS